MNFNMIKNSKAFMRNKKSIIDDESILDQTSASISDFKKNRISEEDHPDWLFR